MQLQAHCQLAPSLLPTDFERPSWWGQICSSNESATERGIEGTRKGYRLSKPNIMASTAVAIGMKTFGQPVYRIDSRPLWGATRLFEFMHPPAITGATPKAPEETRGTENLMGTMNALTRLPWNKTMTSGSSTTEVQVP